MGKHAYFRASYLPRWRFNFNLVWSLQPQMPSIFIICVVAHGVLQKCSSVAPYEIERFQKSVNMSILGHREKVKKSKPYFLYIKHFFTINSIRFHKYVPLFSHSWLPWAPMVGEKYRKCMTLHATGHLSSNFSDKQKDCYLLI